MCPPGALAEESVLDSRLLLPVNTLLDGSYRIKRVVGSGGFGITYEAEDINLGTMVAIKEYYPFDYGDRDATMSVRPKSERHKQTFDWGRSSFLQEARTLARFEHPSIVRVTRVFEAHATAYMVMRFERGMSFEAWLGSLGRPPSQEELDAILHPLLDALEMMHAADFLHRDIAPDNIIVRSDGTPVLLDFGAARRAVAEMSRSLTGIVKAGYSPHEQYSSDGRLQGPWSDLYALGGTLYRAVTGKAPEEATLRFDEDNMASAAKLSRGKYRRDFLTAIDTCLKVRHSERPRSVAQLRPMLLGRMSQPKATERLMEPTYKLSGDRTPSQPRVPSRVPSLPRFSQATVQQVKRRWPAIAAMVAILGGAYGGYEYQRWLTEGGAGAHAVPSGTADAEARRKAAEEAAQRQAALDTERRQKDKEAADARQRQFEIEQEQRRKEMAETQRQAELAEARRRKEQADAAEAEARRKADEARKEEARLAALEAARRKEQAEAEEKRRIAAQEEARRKADAEAAEKRRIAEAEAAEKRRIAALDATRRAEETEAERKRREDQRIAALEEARRSEDRKQGGRAPEARGHPQRHPAGRVRAQDAGDPQAASLLRGRCQRQERRHPGRPQALRGHRQRQGHQREAHRARQGYRRRLRIVAQGRRCHQGQPVRPTAEASQSPSPRPSRATAAATAAGGAPSGSPAAAIFGAAPRIFRAAFWWRYGPDSGNPVGIA